MVTEHHNGVGWDHIPESQCLRGWYRRIMGSGHRETFTHTYMHTQKYEWMDAGYLTCMEAESPTLHSTLECGLLLVYTG